MFTKEFTKAKFLKLLQSTKGRIALVAIAVSLIIPLVLSDDYMIHVLTTIAIFTLYASSWNLLASSGQGSLGHAAFLGIGGFTSSLLAVNLGIPPIIGIFIGGAFSAAIGFLIGITCVRLKAWFLAMVTFGFLVIAETLFRHFDDVTHAKLGFRTPILVSSGLPFYYFAVSITIISVAVMYFIMKSKMGLAFRAIHQNAAEASMIGINTAKYKLYAFMLSTFFAGLSGAIYYHFQRYIHISVFTADNSFKPLMMSVIGGLGTIEGPIIGSITMVLIDDVLPVIDPFLNSVLGSFFPAISDVGSQIRLIGLGIFLVVVVVFLPKGISSLLRKIYRYVRTELSESEKP
jgi:branched-chain amino acid transport system permease protein